jgi:hypothetical protein
MKKVDGRIQGRGPEIRKISNEKTNGRRKQKKEE